MLDPNTPSSQFTPANPYDLSHPIYDEDGVFPDDEPVWPTAGTCTWRDGLQVGDVVVFRYPVRLPGEGDLPKVRPCLVLEVEQRGEDRWALLAYGTSAGTTANRGYVITVGTAAEVAQAGLDRSTRFIGSRRLFVSLQHPDFRPDRTGSPVVGRLGPAAMERLHAVRSRLHAEADIAAERRAEARRERQEQRASRGHVRPVRVERIGSRHPHLPNTGGRMDSATTAAAPLDLERRSRPILGLNYTTNGKGDRA